MTELRIVPVEIRIPSTTPPPPPPPPPGSDQAALIDRVNARLRDFVQVGTCTLVADGFFKNFQLPDSNIVPDSVIIEGVSPEAYEVENQSGWVVFESQPDAGSYPCTYRFKVWSDEEVGWSINDSLDSLFPYFYVNCSDKSLSASPGVYSYEAPEDMETVNHVDVWHNNTWTRIDQWDWNDADHEIQFMTDVPSGTIRLQGIKRYKDKLDFSAEAETGFAYTTGLPESAIPVVVAYASWALASSGAIFRARYSGATATQAKGAMSQTEMLSTVNLLWTNFLQLRSLNAMQPWSPGMALSL